MKTCAGILACMSAGFLSAVAGGEDGATAATKDWPAMKTIAVKNFVFEYTIDGKNFTGKLSYPTEGWVAVGFKPVKKMKGANIIIGSAGGGNFTVADHFGVGEVVHKPDTTIGGADNIISGTCVEKNKVTTMSFTIPLDSGDDKDVVMAAGEKIRIIFAAGTTDDFSYKHVKVAGADVVL